MALVLKDRVKETTATTGTGSVTLSGAATGFQTFNSAIGVGNTTYYCIAGQGTSEWEVGVGTLSASTTLARTTVLASSNGGTAVTFSAGTKDVFVTYPAGRSVSMESGTAMLFAQTAAPSGWTKSTTHDNKALRVVTGAASSGGSVAFTTAFASQGVSGTVGATTLTTAQIPSHAHTLPTFSAAGKAYSVVQAIGSNGLAAAVTSNAEGSGGSHDHGFTGTAINLAVQYVDVIIATKD